MSILEKGIEKVGFVVRTLSNITLHYVVALVCNTTPPILQQGIVIQWNCSNRVNGLRITQNQNYIYTHVNVVNAKVINAKYITANIVTIYKIRLPPFITFGVCFLCKIYWPKLKMKYRYYDSFIANCYIKKIEIYNNICFNEL